MANYWTQKRFRERGVKASNIPYLLVQGVPAEQLFITHKANNMATVKKSITKVSHKTANTRKPINKKPKSNLPSMDDYLPHKMPRVLSKIAGEKIRYRVDFEDKGQDILQMVLEFYPDHVLGYIVDANAQHTMWTKYAVLNGLPKRGKTLQISEAPGKEVLTFKYKITKVETIAPHLWKLWIPSNGNRYDYIDSMVVAAYCAEDIKPMLSVHNRDSMNTFIYEPKLSYAKIGEAELDVSVGIVTESFNAG